MSEKTPVVTLCGSMRFLDDFMRAERALTMEGYVVLGVSGFKMSADNGISHIDEEFQKKLENSVLRKIDMSDEVFVVNKDGYIGNSTRKELKYAQEQGKRISFMYLHCPADCENSALNRCPIIEQHHSVTNFSQNEDCPVCIGYKKIDS